MLKTIDVLIGLSVVMLMVSLVVTMLTQFVVSVINSRGRHLMHGIADLLEQIDPGLTRQVAEEISTKVLTHPVVRASGKRLGHVIHREELTRLLMELAAGSGTEKLSESAAEALRNLLRRDGVSEPGQMLDNVRSLALQLEKANPELAANARQSLAMLQEANSQFLAKINTWFDQTMDRVSARFTGSTRAITVACSLFVAVALQLDTAALVNRLSADDELRRSLVQQAIQLEQSPPAATQLPPAQPGSAVLSLTEEDRRNLSALMQVGVIDLPAPGSWMARWSDTRRPINKLGVLLTAMLLSLGAPFWFNALKNLARLRSLSASKEDSERRERQTTQTPSGAAPANGAAAPSPPSSLLSGERGDLRAFG